jgi:hypothetical protein
MPLSPVGLCNRALLKIGAQPIQSFYDDRVEADIALSFFEPTRDALLSAYPWRFAVAQTTLPQLNITPLADYSYAFQLPDDCLRVLSLGGIAYRRVGNTLQTNASTAIIDYIFRPEDELAPAYFEQALMARLAAEFCLPLTENTSRANLLYELADNEFERSKRIDAQQDTPRALDDFSLINARES